MTTQKPLIQSIQFSRFAQLTVVFLFTELCSLCAGERSGGLTSDGDPALNSMLDQAVLAIESFPYLDEKERSGWVGYLDRVHRYDRLKEFLWVTHWETACLVQMLGKRKGSPGVIYHLFIGVTPTGDVGLAAFAPLTHGVIWSASEVERVPLLRKVKPLLGSLGSLRTGTIGEKPWTSFTTIHVFADGKVTEILHASSVDASAFRTINEAVLDLILMADPYTSWVLRATNGAPPEGALPPSVFEVTR